MILAHEADCRREWQHTIFVEWVKKKERKKERERKRKENKCWVSVLTGASDVVIATALLGQDRQSGWLHRDWGKWKHEKWRRNMNWALRSISKATLPELVRKINKRMRVDNAILLGTLSRQKTENPAPTDHQLWGLCALYSCWNKLKKRKTIKEIAKIQFRSQKTCVVGARQSESAVVLSEVGPTITAANSGEETKQWSWP